MITQNAHDILKDTFSTILEQRDFSVTQEKRVLCPHNTVFYDNYGRKRPHNYFFIDVYGEKDDEIEMYEIGFCEQYKLDWLRSHIGKTIHIPYLYQFSGFQGLYGMVVGRV